MSAEAEPTVRPMFGGQIMRERGAMDEATIDCRCGEPGVYDVVLQALDDRAEWYSFAPLVRCQTHLPVCLENVTEMLQPDQRVVLTRR